MPDAGPGESAAHWELAVKYLLHPNNPQRLLSQFPASQSLTAGNDKEISTMTVPSYQSEIFEKLICLSLILS